MVADLRYRRYRRPVPMLHVRNVTISPTPRIDSLCLFFTSSFIMLAGGCIAPCNWNTTVCYEGPSRALPHISILLVNTTPLAVFRVRSIDDISVPDCVEFHLSPGHHSIVTGVSRGKTTDMPIACTLHAGHVYSLVPDVWNLSNRFIAFPIGFWRVKCDWRPRLVDLGRFAQFTSSQYVHPTVLEHARPHPLHPVLARQNVAGVDPESAYAHFVGNLPFGSELATVQMPAKHWGLWPTFRQMAQGDVRADGS